MACTNCTKSSTPAAVEAGIPASGDVATLSFSAATTHVTGRDGIKRRIDGPLVEMRNRGRGGWRVSIPVKGHVHAIDGQSPQEVFRQASALLKTNGLVIRDIDLWFNLNKQWIERSIAKRQPVTMANLMDAAVGNNTPASHAKGRQNVPPAVWGRKGWGMLQQYLAKDAYDYQVFLMLATELSTWVDPDVSPATGCSECFQHYSIVLAKLRKTPLYSQREAREWLVDAMNRVNKLKGARQFTYEKAAQENYWQ